MKNIILISLALAAFAWSLFQVIHKEDKLAYQMNTSNPGKIAEFQHLFKKHRAKLNLSKIDLDEVDADPLTVIIHKASQLEEGTLVDDTSLEVDGADVGVNIRWLLDDLKNHQNKKATATVLLAHRKNDQIYIYKGEVKGTLVAKRIDKGFGFDPYFLPDGTNLTLAEAKPDKYNPRALAVDALIKKCPFAVQPPIKEWDGPWQQHD